MSVYLLVCAHPEYPDPLGQARASTAMVPTFAGLPMQLALDERLPKEHITILPMRKRWWQRLHVTHQ